MGTVRLSMSDYVKRMERRQTETPAAIRRGLVAGGMRAIAIAQAAVDVAPPASDEGSDGAFDTGNYKRRFRGMPIPNGYRVLNDAPYSSVIEDGRRAGAKFPPLKAIAAWARRKLGLSRKEAEEAAYPIARAIARRGLRARKVVANASDEMARAFVEEVEKAVRAVADWWNK